jgi:hypothetical protein
MRLSEGFINFYFFTFYGEFSSEVHQWDRGKVLVFGRIQYSNLKVSPFLNIRTCDVMSVQLCQS